MLTTRVFVPHPEDPTQEDIFSSSLSTIFSDVQNSHGTPGQHVTYASPRYGEIELEIPAHPDVEEGRKLFAHYLWNAAVVVAEAIENASTIESHQTDDTAVDVLRGEREGQDGTLKTKWSRWWDVRDRECLELGAGTALPSLIASLCGAKSATITDHPQSPALVNDTIARNVKHNLGIDLFPNRSVATDSTAPDTTLEQSADTGVCGAGERRSGPRTSTTIAIHGLTWGAGFTNPFKYGKPSVQPPPNSFDRMIVADCLWMPSQHANIVKTIQSNLRDGGCALVVAGFHTGRSIVSRFFEIATGSRSAQEDCRQNEEEDEEIKSVKGCLVAEEIFEIDVELRTRAWEWQRHETKDEAKRWVVCAVLRRK